MTVTSTNASCSGSHTSSPSITGLILHAATIYRERRALSRMSPAALRDIGVTLADAKIEANRPFWDLPTQPRR